MIEWIRATEENQNDIRVGDFVSVSYGDSLIYKVLKVKYVEDGMFLDVGVCDKKGNIERKDWVYYSQPITCFDCYLPQNRKAKVV